MWDDDFGDDFRNISLEYGSGLARSELLIEFI